MPSRILKKRNILKETRTGSNINCFIVLQLCEKLSWLRILETIALKIIAGKLHWHTKQTMSGLMNTWLIIVKKHAKTTITWSIYNMWKLQTIPNQSNKNLIKKLIFTQKHKRVLNVYSIEQIQITMTVHSSQYTMISIITLKICHNN